MVHTYLTELAFFSVELIGDIGSIKIDTQIFDHNTKLDLSSLTVEEQEKLKNEQIITIGNEGEKITKEHVKDFLSKLYNYIVREEFDNECDYEFCGIDEIEPKHYVIDWL